MSEIEALEKKKKRLIFRSWHRGTREMDLLMGTFADAHVMGMDEVMVAEYEDLLQENDPDLYNWYSGREKAPAERECKVFQLFLNHRYAA